MCRFSMTVVVKSESFDSRLGLKCRLTGIFLVGSDIFRKFQTSSGKLERMTTPKPAYLRAVPQDIDVKDVLQNSFRPW